MGALYHLKQKLVDFCNVIQENVSRTDTVPSSKVVYDLKADSDSQISTLNDSLTNIENVTSQFVLGSTISITSFKVYKRGKHIFGYFRGSTSADNSTTNDPVLFTIPTEFIPYSNYTICAPNVWVTNSHAIFNVFYNGSAHTGVFASKAYVKNAQYAFSFDWEMK